MKHNLLFIYPILPPNPGGAAICGKLLLEEMGKRLDDFNMITVLVEHGVNIKSSSIINIKDKLLKYISINSNNKLIQLINYFIIIKYIISGKYGIIHIHSRYIYANYVGYILYKLLLISKKRVIIDLRDKFYNKPSLQHFQHVVCSEDLMCYYNWLSNKTMIPVPIKLNQIDQLNQEHSICYIGDLAESKGVIELIRGYKLYHKRSKNPLELKLYGPNKIGNKLNDMINNVPNINYYGIISYDQIPCTISSNKGIILPSKSEGIPRIALEAIFYNRIIILHSSVEVLKEYIPDEFILNYINKNEIYDKLFMIENRMSHFVEYNYNFDQHNPKEIVNSWINIYNDS